MSELTERIKTRAYWTVEIAPAEFNARRLDLVQLDETVRDCAVQSRGWQYPWVDSREPPRRLEDRLVSESAFETHLERWEFCRSGLFLWMHAHPPDWRSESGWWPLRASEESPLTYIGVLWAVGMITDFCHFAARLARSRAGDQGINLEVALENVANRILRSDAPNRAPFFASYRYSGASLKNRRQVSRDELAANYEEIAQEIAADFFTHFGWSAERRILKSMQDELRR